jgi:hypothetical protein
MIMTADTFFNTNARYNSVSQTLLLVDPFWLRKITTDPHIPIECPEDKSKVHPITGHEGPKGE